MGTSQVSVRTKRVKATWIAGLPQWKVWSSGPTNSVQPYWRLAIITMLRMPRKSWAQRMAGGCTAAGAAADVSVGRSTDGATGGVTGRATGPGVKGSATRHL